MVLFGKKKPSVCQCSICSVGILSGIVYFISVKQPKVPTSEGKLQPELSAGFFLLNSGSREGARALAYSPQRTHPSGIFRKGCSILCHVVCLFAKWEAREYPGWHFGFDGPFTSLSDVPHVKKCCFLPVSSHLREQFSSSYFPPIWC